MKKLLKILILVIGFIPLLINAEEKEVKYKWYKETEENIRYDNYAENVCEYFDKNTFITTDWYYSTSKPTEENYRIIEEVTMDIEISSYYSKYLEFKYFPMYGLKIYELELYDEENNIIEYNLKQDIINNQNTDVLKDGKLEDFINITANNILEIELNEITNIINMKILIYHEKNLDFTKQYIYTYALEGLMNNAFGSYEEEFNTECDENICITEITFIEENCLTEPTIITTAGYRYQDKFYKCYDKKIEYAPGYHVDLTSENYIKDESDFIIIEESNTSSQVQDNLEFTCPSSYPSNIVEIKPISQNEEGSKEPITENITNEIEPQIPKIESPLAMVTKENITEEKNPKYLVFLTIFAILSILYTIVLIAKKLKK